MKQVSKYFIFSLMLLVLACDSSKEINTITAGLQYFPLTVGNSWTYDVTEVRYDTLINDVTENYQEKYEIIDSYKNQLDESVYVIHVSNRSDETSDWLFSQTWSAKVSVLNEIIVSEENTAYLKILLPVYNGLTWKGNKYNTIESTRTNNRVDNFVIQNFGKPYESFSKSMKVQESEESNFVYEDLRYSVYAQQVGLVYRINKYVEYCDDGFCFGLGIRNHEVTKIQTLAEYEVQ